MRIYAVATIIWSKGQVFSSRLHNELWIYKKLKRKAHLIYRRSKQNIAPGYAVENEVHHSFIYTSGYIPPLIEKDAYAT